MAQQVGPIRAVQDEEVGHAKKRGAVGGPLTQRQAAARLTGEELHSACRYSARMCAAPPLLLNLQGARRRLLYVTLFEGLAIAIVTLALLVFTGAGAASASGLAIGSSAIALGWNLVFNMLFERWERRQPTRGRSAARRVAHAIGFEGGLLLFLVPFFAWWLGVSLWQALVLDIGFLLFFLVYNFVFAWAFDRLFGLPAGVG